MGPRISRIPRISPRISPLITLISLIIGKEVDDGEASEGIGYRIYLSAGGAAIQGRSLSDYRLCHGSPQGAGLRVF